MKILKHLHTINTHKLMVMKMLFKVGLYKQGLLHDMSKYTYTELRVGAKYYQGYRSPNNAEREALGYSSAWLHHKGRNKHHFEYWIDYSTNKESAFEGIRMPVRYVVEMFVDRVAASKTYQKENYRDDHPLFYYEQGVKKLGNMIHPDTSKLLHHLLRKLAKEGEKETFRYIRKEILKK
ncbi:hypothetical protein M2454_001653 [Aequitasia blattaphilus]|uniref:DUF5662 family protein n=1 Tax=Aequitasia blattaphilus TaxID=2949332 RepID=A0ABT1EAH8_9FIRM|nr:DUF5662 family protein [Aequitasia blattaphilus]MCP1101512.1 DUF5662 family protein [Aequitasia blattaphilus]MCR8614152.1 DUF5662 family protein [Aequitasia blattaphilus]